MANLVLPSHSTIRYKFSQMMCYFKKKGKQLCSMMTKCHHTVSDSVNPIVIENIVLENSIKQYMYPTSRFNHCSNACVECGMIYVDEWSTSWYLTYHQATIILVIYLYYWKDWNNICRWIGRAYNTYRIVKAIKNQTISVLNV